MWTAASRAGSGAGGGGARGGGGDGGGGVSARRGLAFRDAVQYTLQELAQLQDCMLQMNVKMDKMKDVVGLVALGFQVHKLGVTKIDRRLQAVECRLDAREGGEDEDDEDEEKEEDYARGRTAVNHPEFEEQMLSVSREVPTDVVSPRGDCQPSTRHSRTPPPPNSTTASPTSIVIPLPSATSLRDVSRPAQPPAFAVPTAAVAVVRPRRRSPHRSPHRSPTLPQRPSRLSLPPYPPRAPRPNRTAAKRRAQLGRQLLQAVEEGSAEEVAKLLDCGADANFSAARRWVPLHRAARKANTELVSLLLRRGADVNARTSYGFTALHIAAYNDPSGSCAALLVAAGCDMDGKTKSGRTALHAAAETGNAAAARVLVAAGATARVRDDAGKTPADVARTQELQELLEMAANTQQKQPPVPLLRELQTQGHTNDGRARE